MPLVAPLTQNQELAQRLAKRKKRIKHLICDYDIRQDEIAVITGLTQQAVSHQLRKKEISPQVEEAINMIVEKREGEE